VFISEITVNNYRNVSNETIRFSKPCTYIVGENSLGKTNLLSFLHSVFSKRCLEESDFYDKDLAVSATIKLRLSPSEIGLFNDIADPFDTSNISISISVEDVDSDFSFLHQPTGEQIHPSMMRRICFFLFETLNANSRALDYDRKHGVGRVLSKGLGIYQEKNGLSTLDFFNTDKLQGLIDYLNGLVSNITLLAPYGIHAGVDNKEAEILGAIVTLTDENDLHFRRTSSGVQYIALAIMQIFEAIMRLSNSKLSDSITTNSKGERVLSTIIAFDEPEAHLHPYMQRTLVKYLCSVASGEDDGFNALLKEYFDVDKLDSQIIIATHSPSMLSPDYESIVRFGQCGEGNVSVKCGIDLSLDSQIQKQLIAQFDSIKEAFFSRGALVVEGISEAVAIREFSLKQDIDLDRLGIILVAADGKRSVPSVCKLLEEFDIPVGSIVDRDDGSHVSAGASITTDERDLEAELVESLFGTANQSVFVTFLENYESAGRRHKLYKSQLEKAAKKYHPDWFNGYCFEDMNFVGSRFDGDFQDDNLTRLMMYSWLSSNKGAVFYKMIGDAIPVEAVPQCYKSIVSTLTGMVS